MVLALYLGPLRVRVCMHPSPGLGCFLSQGPAPEALICRTIWATRVCFVDTHGKSEVAGHSHFPGAPVSGPLPGKSTVDPPEPPTGSGWALPAASPPAWGPPHPGPAPRPPFTLNLTAAAGHPARTAARPSPLCSVPRERASYDCSASP